MEVLNIWTEVEVPFFRWDGKERLKAMPFAVWLFLAIEQLPLAAEESVDPKKDMPKGLTYGIITLIISAFLILWLNASIPLGSLCPFPIRGALIGRI